MPVMQNNFNREKYLNLLKKLYGFYSSVETSLQNQLASQALEISYQERMKLEALKADLLALGVSEDELKNLPKIESNWLPQDEESTLGLLYVLEGSTLGGQVISRHLKSQLQLDDSSGLRFFSAYGQKTGLMWKSFQGILNQKLKTEPQMKKAAFTAQITFEKLGSWLKS